MAPLDVRTCLGRQRTKKKKKKEVYKINGVKHAQHISSAWFQHTELVFR